MILIYDYDVGNIKSIINMLKRTGEQDIVVSSEINDIQRADKIILPGVGHFDHGMRKLIAKPNSLELLKHRVIVEKIPILGICLGAQLLCNSSEEGEILGLGWIDAIVVKFNFANTNTLPIPNMGWCDTNVIVENKLTQNLHDSRFYFVHSYHIKCKYIKNNILEANYGYNFTAGISKDNIFGVQFHPEKSHKFGLRLFENFCKL